MLISPMLFILPRSALLVALAPANLDLKRITGHSHIGDYSNSVLANCRRLWSV